MHKQFYHYLSALSLLSDFSKTSIIAQSFLKSISKYIFSCFECDWQCKFMVDICRILLLKLLSPNIKRVSQEKDTTLLISFFRYSLLLRACSTASNLAASTNGTSGPNSGLKCGNLSEMSVSPPSVQHCW